jgi:hypothetical protein
MLQTSLRAFLRVYYLLTTIMVERYTIKINPAVSHKEIMKAFEQGAGITPEHTDKLTKVKARIEVIGDYADMEKVQDLLNQFSKK